MAQNDTGVRVGRVSSINYQAGTARVVFGDKDSAVTKEVPFVSNNEYNMPLVGDLVQVSHNSNGTMAATIPGSTWNQNNKPYEGGRGIFRKEYSNTKNKCFERFNDNTGEFMRRVPGLLLYQSRETYMEASGKAGLTGGGAVTVTSTGAQRGRASQKRRGSERGQGREPGRRGRHFRRGWWQYKPFCREEMDAHHRRHRHRHHHRRSNRPI